MKSSERNLAYTLVAATAIWLGILLLTLKRDTFLLYITGAGILMLLAFAQNVSFSIVSRSRNRDNMTYHMIAAVFSNGIWFLTFQRLVTANMSFTLFIPYTIATVAGSLFGMKVSMLIEKVLGATSDSHLEKK
jgi:hypothetical protein